MKELHALSADLNRITNAGSSVGPENTSKVKEILGKLRGCSVTVDDLRFEKLGRVVAALRKSDDKAIKQRSKDLVTKWKKKTALAQETASSTSRPTICPISGGVNGTPPGTRFSPRFTTQLSSCESKSHTCIGMHGGYAKSSKDAGRDALLEKAKAKLQSNYATTRDNKRARSLKTIDAPAQKKSKRKSPYQTSKPRSSSTQKAQKAPVHRARPGFMTASSSKYTSSRKAAPAPAPVKAVISDKPDCDWEKKFSVSSQKYYFKNVKTDATQWDVPEEYKKAVKKLAKKQMRQESRKGTSDVQLSAMDLKLIGNLTTNANARKAASSSSSSSTKPTYSAWKSKGPAKPKIDDGKTKAQREKEKRMAAIKARKQEQQVQKYQIAKEKKVEKQKKKAVKEEKKKADARANSKFGSLSDWRSKKEAAQKQKAAQAKKRPASRGEDRRGEGSSRKRPSGRGGRSPTGQDAEDHYEANYSSIIAGMFNKRGRYGGGGYGGGGGYYSDEDDDLRGMEASYDEIQMAEEYSSKMGKKEDDEAVL